MGYGAGVLFLLKKGICLVNLTCLLLSFCDCHKTGDIYFKMEFYLG